MWRQTRRWQALRQRQALRRQQALRRRQDLRRQGRQALRRRQARAVEQVPVWRWARKWTTERPRRWRDHWWVSQVGRQQLRIECQVAAGNGAT